MVLTPSTGDIHAYKVIETQLLEELCQLRGK